MRKIVIVAFALLTIGAGAELIHNNTNRTALYPGSTPPPTCPDSACTGIQ